MYDHNYRTAKLIVLLTMPLREITKETPKEYVLFAEAYKSVLDTYQQFFLNRDLVAILIGILEEPLMHDERTDDDIMTMELFLTLVRNLLVINSNQKTVRVSPVLCIML